MSVSPDVSMLYSICHVLVRDITHCAVVVHCPCIRCRIFATHEASETLLHSAVRGLQTCRCVYAQFWTVRNVNVRIMHSMNTCLSLKNCCRLSKWSFMHLGTSWYEIKWQNTGRPYNGEAVSPMLWYNNWWLLDIVHQGPVVLLGQSFDILVR